MKKIYLIIIIIIFVLYFLLNIAALKISSYTPNSLHIRPGIVNKPLQRIICHLSAVCTVIIEPVKFGDVETLAPGVLTPKCICIFNR